MKALASDILAKVDGLPPDFREHVTIDTDDKSLAYVKSFSKDETYTVHIGIHKDDPGDKSILQTVCACDARTLCKHVTAFYAVSKGLAPQIDSDTKDVQEPVKGKCDELRRLLAEEINARSKVIGELIRLIEGVS